MPAQTSSYAFLGAVKAFVSSENGRLFTLSIEARYSVRRPIIFSINPDQRFTV